MEKGSPLAPYRSFLAHYRVQLGLTSFRLLPRLSYILLPKGQLAAGVGSGRKSQEPRRRSAADILLARRRALTHQFSIAGQEGYFTVRVYEDGQPGEIFITMRSRARPSPDSWIRLQLRYRWLCNMGVPLDVLCSKFTHVRFELSGWSGNPKIG